MICVQVLDHQNERGEKEISALVFSLVSLSPNWLAYASGRRADAATNNIARVFCI